MLESVRLLKRQSDAQTEIAKALQSQIESLPKAETAEAQVILAKRQEIVVNLVNIVETMSIEIEQRETWEHKLHSLKTAQEKLLTQYEECQQLVEDDPQIFTTKNGILLTILEEIRILRIEITEITEMVPKSERTVIENIDRNLTELVQKVEKHEQSLAKKSDAIRKLQSNLTEIDAKLFRIEGDLNSSMLSLQADLPAKEEAVKSCELLRENLKDLQPKLLELQASAAEFGSLLPSETNEIFEKLTHLQSSTDQTHFMLDDRVKNHYHFIEFCDSCQKDLADCEQRMKALEKVKKLEEAMIQQQNMQVIFEY